MSVHEVVDGHGPEDLDRLQVLLDTSYAAAGAHLRAIHTPATRLDAAQLVASYRGMQVLVVATVSADGRPFTGPVDSFLWRGRLHFGTAHDAVRARQLRRSPEVSATHVRGEELVVTVHGRVRELDLAGTDRDFAAVTRAWYGTGWDEWGDPPVAWAIEPVRLFAADMSVHQHGGAN
jgi:hypothetical protein